MTEQLEGQMSIYDLDSQCGKTSPVHSAVTKEKTSMLSSKRSQASNNPELLYLNLRKESGIIPDVSWVKVGRLPGVYTMLNFGESPSVESASTLLQILEEPTQENSFLKPYLLSKRACQGILNRASKRGKTLPELLQNALEEVVNESSCAE